MTASVFSRKRDDIRVLRFEPNFPINSSGELMERITDLERLARSAVLINGQAHDTGAGLRHVGAHVDFACDHIRSGNYSEAIEMLGHAKAGVSNLSKMFMAMLAYSGGRSFTREVFSLPDMVTETVSFLKPAFTASVTFEVRIKEGNFTVCGNKTQIQQILVNLAQNAQQAFCGKNGKITIAVHGLHRRVDQEITQGSASKYVAFSVVDNGVGMSEEVFAQIAQPFFTTKLNGDGSGLGLVMAKFNADANDGVIAAATKIGKGSVFTVYLPSYRS